MVIKNHLKLSHNTKKSSKEEGIKQRILEDSKEYFHDSLPALKNDSQFIIDICVFIENELGKKKVDRKKYDKKSIAIESLKALFELDEEDVIRISSIIDTFHQNNLIKRDKLTKTLYKYLKNFIINFFLPR